MDRDFLLRWCLAGAVEGPWAGVVRATLSSGDLTFPSRGLPKGAVALAPESCLALGAPCPHGGFVKIVTESELKVWNSYHREQEAFTVCTTPVTAVVVALFQNLGMDLLEFLNTYQDLSEATRLAVARSVLQEIHDAGKNWIVCDVKPENMVVRICQKPQKVVDLIDHGGWVRSGQAGVGLGHSTPRFTHPSRPDDRSSNTNFAVLVTVLLVLRFDLVADWLREVEPAAQSYNNTLLARRLRSDSGRQELAAYAQTSSCTLDQLFATTLHLLCADGTADDLRKCMGLVKARRRLVYEAWRETAKSGLGEDSAF